MFCISFRDTSNISPTSLKKLRVQEAKLESTNTPPGFMGFRGLGFRGLGFRASDSV